jgi:para-nitrobenzyl esterase
MMPVKALLISGALLLIAPHAIARPDEAPTTPAVSAGAAQPRLTINSKIGALLADPAAKAVLEKYVPDLVADHRFKWASFMTLKHLGEHHRDSGLTDEVLAAINDDLAKLSVAARPD